MLDLISSGPDPSRPVHDPLALPSRNGAAQRRAMRGAMAGAVRAMRTTAMRRASRAGRGAGQPPAGV